MTLFDYVLLLGARWRWLALTGVVAATVAGLAHVRSPLPPWTAEARVWVLPKEASVLLGQLQSQILAREAGLGPGVSITVRSEPAVIAGGEPLARVIGSAPTAPRAVEAVNDLLGVIARRLDRERAAAEALRDAARARRREEIARLTRELAALPASRPTLLDRESWMLQDGRALAVVIGPPPRTLVEERAAMLRERLARLEQPEDRVEPSPVVFRVIDPAWTASRPTPSPLRAVLTAAALGALAGGLLVLVAEWWAREWAARGAAIDGTTASDNP